MPPIRLQALRDSDDHACVLLREQLVRERYAVIALDESCRQTLEGALEKFEPDATFRFPARDGDSQYMTLVNGA